MIRIMTMMVIKSVFTELNLTELRAVQPTTEKSTITQRKTIMIITMMTMIVDSLMKTTPTMIIMTMMTTINMKATMTMIKMKVTITMIKTKATITTVKKNTLTIMEIVAMRIIMNTKATIILRMMIKMMKMTPIHTALPARIINTTTAAVPILTPIMPLITLTGMNMTVKLMLTTMIARMTIMIPQKELVMTMKMTIKITGTSKLKITLTTMTVITGNNNQTGKITIMAKMEVKIVT